MRRVLALALLGVAATAFAGPVEDNENAIRSQMRADVGKTFWIELPDGRGVALCQSATSIGCPFIYNTRFVVLDVSVGKERAAPRHHYKVRLADGRIGFVLYEGSRDRFLSRPLSNEERAVNSNCEQRGYPSIGMSKDQVIACMGQPEIINTTETTLGKQEQMVYRQFGYVYIEDNQVTAIQSSR